MQNRERETAQHPEVGGSVIFADSALVFCKSYIQTPMQSILDAPVAAHGPGKRLHLRRQAAQIADDLLAELAVDFTRPQHHADAGDIFPLVLPHQLSRRRGDHILPRFLATMTAFERLVAAHCRSATIPTKRLLYELVQLPLVVFDGEHIVGAPGSSRATTRPKVSGEGMPLGRSRNWRKKVSLALAKRAMSTQPSAPPSVAQTARMTRLRSSCRLLRSMRGSVSLPKCGVKSSLSEEEGIRHLR